MKELYEQANRKENQSLRLIGLYLYSMSSDIGKNLKAGWYPFGKYPEPKEGYLKVPSVSDVAANIYKESNRSPKITVGCIVGKNGAGKSTLLDIMYRIINNLAYRLASCKNIPIPTKLSYANGVNAELYYVCDGKLNRIVCNHNKVAVYRESNFGLMSKIDILKCIQRH